MILNAAIAARFTLESAADVPRHLLQLYDFPSPKLHSPQRESTTSPLQQLFMMNSDFIREQSEAFVENSKAVCNNDVDDAADDGEQFNVSQSSTAIVRAMYRRVVSREPTDEELQIAEQFLKTATLAEYAQALLASNEVIFWP